MRRKLWKVFSLLVVVFVLLSFMLPMAVVAEEEMAVVYVRVPQDWQEPHIWAWDEAGNNAFPFWPGMGLEADPNNPGWYFAYVPGNMTYVIVNAGGLQTEDLSVAALPVWITVISEGEVELVYEAQTVGTPPAYVPHFTVFARPPADWGEVAIRGSRPNWSGVAMRRVGDWYAAHAPHWVNNIVITGNGGGLRTADLRVTQTMLWVLVEEDTGAEVFYENPDFMAPPITVRAQVPGDWDAPHLWAWLHPEGTNLFSPWPGEPMIRDGDGYMLRIPGWVNSLIVNANDGTVQTGNMHDVEIGVDVWILVLDAERYGFDYQEITELPEPVAEPEAENEAEAEVSDEADVSTEGNDGNDLLIIWVVIGIGAAVLLAGVIIIVKATRNKGVPR
ncbi:MAG: starch-binding protein [Defluviitaleaceae bacterium]|nr:starch-binding protein [Defluviitaleaceae bacterium]MCL2238891.1 starch-binding protein [Defluviitaleaceae bacterium]